MKFTAFFVVALLSISTCAAQEQDKKGNDERLIKGLRYAAKEQLLEKWYPLTLDKEDGGYYSEITHDFKVGEEHNKMIVTQARHVWTNARASEIFAEKDKYLEYARHGFEFLRDVMWDAENGGFYQLVTKAGEPILQQGQEKTAYGNSFAIYGLAAYYRASGNEEALELAKRAFHWLEEHSHDPEYKGYYQSLNLDGTPIKRTPDFPSTSDVGYKDQNSSIHLLEAFTELYQVWPDELLAERLEEMLVLIRDTITTEKGYMNLFFEPDWTPVSFRNKSREEIQQHYYLDHVSFGHDVETAYLMLEATHALGLDEELTLRKGKKMLDHALSTGWDEEIGGFYDGGYYFEGATELEIINDEKNWWSQAEGLNTLLIMEHYFPEDALDYRKYFDKLWVYTQLFFMDELYGGWYEWGLDAQPEVWDDSKGHIWKAAYHNFRALTNCFLKLEEGE
ncbi:AGE family epimerase/isomerase [Autumnicola edwardsiae]|uniref:AGE family epimerase/isomerase n=1 Tax=Autumnicola edwardsiae TaxID=3075594 RepID=A0ABU3CWB2_9FLAO|nr:AGE family epimerase/isomerase [Zunongwangia sp. F297]MDT0650596.1 AGE family epimerase/isomerase [Zunongwangia sp. F297]